jgi:citrate lyase subunit beta/citryl-CoA lyase
MKKLTAESGPAYLFCPASRPDRYQKALDVADFAILDLEDAVATADKAAARQALLDHPLDPDAVIVRVNAIGTEDFEADMQAVRSADYRRIMVPKAEDAGAIATIDGFEVIALCETAPGVLSAAAIASVPNVVALMWGAEDLIVSLGGRSSRRDDGTYLDVAIHARSTVLLAAAASGKPAIDAVHLDIEDQAGLEAEAHEAALAGFIAKACIHPAQVAAIRESWLPSEDQRSWAARVLRHADEGGVSVVAGQMIDGPLLALARRIMDREATGGG